MARKFTLLVPRREPAVAVPIWEDCYGALVRKHPKAARKRRVRNKWRSRYGLVLVALVAFSLGCGSDSKDAATPAATPTPVPTHAAWVDSYRASVVSECIDKSMATFSVPSSKGLLDYCVCLRTQYETRWEQADFAAHRAEYETAMTTDGTAGKCRTQYPF